MRFKHKKLALSDTRLNFFIEKLLTIELVFQQPSY